MTAEILWNGVPQRRFSHYTGTNGTNSNGHNFGMTISLANGNERADWRAPISKTNQDEITTAPDDKLSEETPQLPASAARSSPLSTTKDDPSLAWKRDGKVYNQGPDQILPSTAIHTWNVDGATRICNSGYDEMRGDDELSRITPISVPTLLQNAVQRSPERTALAVKRDGEWQKWSYEQYLKDVRTVAKGFIALGLEKYHAVCILGFNSPEWVISNMAAIYAGGISAGIYTTNSSEACAFVAGDSNANIFVVDDEKQLEKVLQIKDRLPKLKAIIQYSGTPKKAGVYSWSELMKLGLEQKDTILEDPLKHISINQCCSLVYTSGTTGNPKGVMLSHDNLTWLAKRVCAVCNLKEAAEEYISFLPLNHAAPQMADIYCTLTCSASTYFADKNSLKGSLIDTMREVKPTIFFSVPRVWEKIYEKMQEIGKRNTGLKKMMATWAKSEGLQRNLNRMNGVTDSESLGFKVANRLILSKVRDALGLTRCKLHLSGAAPLNVEVFKYFMSLNIVITELYGMSECSGPHSIATESAFRLGSVGRTTMGVNTKLGKTDEDGNGEICIAGRHVQMGYLNQPEKTIGAIDEDGWLHSEDIGKLDEDGYLYVTGRIKELLITAGGENVPPVPIEDNVKSTFPIVSQAMLIGDRLKFLSILLTLKTDVNIETQEPLNTLLPSSREWINKSGDCDVITVSDVIEELYEKKNQKLVAAFQAGIDEANKKAVSRAQLVQKWHILPVDFSIAGGELTPTLKLKRKTVQEKYQHVVDEFYNSC